METTFNNYIVSKFGGTSLASAEAILTVCDIIRQNKGRKFVVVSAPGKEHKKDTKITDLLYKCFEEIVASKDCPSFKQIDDRFKNIVLNLGLKLDIASLLEKTKKQILQSSSLDFVVSRGEYLLAQILAECLNYNFVDATKLVRFNPNGVYDAEQTFLVAQEALKELPNAVIPGFYGADENGSIFTFSRGGSDVTGAIVARAVKASLYENWTDVNGVLTCDPSIVDNPQLIYCLSYKELREMSYMGASVLHSESIFPVSAFEIPINIRNTFNLNSNGTMIVPDIYDVKDFNQITGIVGKKDFFVVHIEKDLMNNEIGFIRKVLSVFENYAIPVEHVPSGIDTLSIVVASKCLECGIAEKILQDIKKATNAEKVEIKDKLALISTVGRNMLTDRRIASRLLCALNNKGVVVKLIDFGSGGLNIIVGVEEKDFERAICALYEEFFNKNI